MTVNGLWPAINACVEPTLAKVTNRIATAAYYIFSQIPQRQAVQNPPAPPPRRTDPQDSEDDDDDGMNRGLDGTDKEKQTPPPAEPFAPVASTSDLNRQPPFRPPSPASSLSSLSSLPSSKSSDLADDPRQQVPPHPPPTPPTHHIFEIAPYEEAEKAAMLAHPVTSCQPLEKFMDQLLIQVLIRIMLVQEDWGRHFPNIRIGWIFEGNSTKEKENKLKERVKKEGEAQVQGDWKEQQRERIKARRAKKRLKKAEAISKKRIAQNGGVGNGGRAELDEGVQEEEQEEEEEGDMEEVEETGNKPAPDGSRRLRSSEIPRLKAPKKVEPVDYSLLSADSQFVHCLRTHVRYLQANGEAEHAITPAALINSWILTPEQQLHVSYVSYADGADPSIFLLPPLQVLSHSPDGDQASLFTELVVGWIVNNPSYGVVNFLKLAFETPTGTPQHLRLPTDKKKTVPSIRIVNTRDLFFDKRIYPLPTIECRATIPVYTGNDYEVGGHRVGYGTFRNGKHARLMEISCKPNLQHEITPTLDTEYRRLLRSLPPSDYVASLTLTSFLKKRNTNRAIDIETFNKQDFYAAHLRDVKQEKNDAREARRLQTEEQTKRVGGKNRRNHAHFPEHKWPKAILENDDDGGGGGLEGGGAGSAKKGNGKGKEKAIDQDAVEPDVDFSSPSDSAQPSTSLDDSDEWEDEEDVEEEPIESLDLRDPVQIEMPDDKTSWAWRRRSNPLFHSQTLKAMAKVTTPPPTIPTKPPSDPPLQKGKKSNKLQDFGCPFKTRRRRVESAYKEMIVRGPRRITNRRHQRALKRRFMRVDESIRSTGVVTAAAVGRTVAKLFDVLVRKRPHLLSDFKFKGYYMKQLVTDVSALRAGIDEGTGIVKKGEDAEKKDPMKLSIRQACDEDESCSNQKFNSRDPRKRIRPVLSHFVTACERVIPARLKKVQPFERLVYAVLTSPEPTLKKLDEFLSALFPHHKHIGMFSQELNRLSSQSASLWSRLASKTSLIKPLMKLLVEYILSQRPPPYVPGETRIDWVLDISLPDDLSNTLASTFARLSTRIVTLDDPANKYRSSSQATQDNARMVLVNVLRLLATFLPFAYVDYGGDAVFQSKKMIFDDDEILDAVAADDFFPRSHSIHALVTRDVGSEPCKEFWTATGGFKLAILSIAGGQKLDFGPTSFDFDAATTHRYVKTPKLQPKGTPRDSTRQLRPALYDVLRDHLDNTEKAVRFAAQRIDTASSVPTFARSRRDLDSDDDTVYDDSPPLSRPASPVLTAPSTPSDPFERPATPSELSETLSIPSSTLPPFVSDAEEWMDVDESTDPETILRNSEFLPPRILTRFLERLINAARRATNSNLVEEFNQLIFLSSAERIAFLHYARPDLKFVESLAGNPHYLLTDKIDRFGYARFIINAKLIAQDAKYTMQFYEAILPDLNHGDRENALNNLRQEVLPLRFNWQQLGNFVPNGYTKTPASVNLISIDPRQATSVPASHFPKPPRNSKEEKENNDSKKPKPRNFIQFTEEVLHITGPYKHFKRGVIDEFYDTKTRDARGKPIYLQRPILPFLDEKKQWTAARKVRRRKPAGPPSTVDPLVPRLLMLKYRDDDFPNHGLHDKTFETDEEEEEAKQIAQGNFELFQFRVLGETGPKVTKLLSGTDGGQIVIGSTTNYFQQTGQCVTDALKRNNFVGRDRTSQQVRKELSSYLNEEERDDDFRSLNPKPRHEKKKDGALTSIKEYNKLNPDDLISTTLAQPSQLSNVYNFERTLDHDQELRRAVGRQVSTLLPFKPDHTYQVTYMLSTSKLPKTGIEGRELYSVYERMWCEELNAREDVDLVVFTMPEMFTSSHCIFCDRSVVFHPESLETGQPLPRLTICHHCKNIFHRDNLASQLYVQSAVLAALTGIFGFSPAHEIDIFGRYLEERLSDGERRRPRRTELELMAAYYARDYLRKQNRAFNPPQDRSNEIVRDEEDRERLQEAIQADDAEEKLPNIRKTKKEEPLPEIARPVGTLSTSERKRMAEIERNNPHLQT